MSEDEFTVRITVRGYETDAQGHLNQAVYLQYAEHARWAHLEAAGVRQADLLAKGVGPVVLETTVKYRRELRAGDEVDVSCAFEWGGGKTFRVVQRITRTDGVLAAEVGCVGGFLDLAARRLVDDPREPMLTLGSNPALLGLSWGMRQDGVGGWGGGMTDVGADPGRFDPWPAAEVHVEWGPTGARLAAERGDAVVVVDVLSFSTTLTVAAERDFTCLVHSPSEVDDLGGLQTAAGRLDARPMSRDRRPADGGVSLSPASLLTAEPGQRVLFTSLNGAAVVAAATDAPALLVGGLRNATACAAAAAATGAPRITVVPCGERWSSVAAGADGADGMRPSLEDWLGAGLICRRLGELGLRLSAEARVAADAWSGPAASALADCVSARELVAAGFADDVRLALAVDATDRVPTRTAARTFV